jgi:hypothetical protein
MEKVSLKSEVMVNDEKKAVIIIEKTEEVISTNEVTEQIILDTIDMLNERKQAAIDSFDAEIAINEEMLKKVQAIDRKAVVDASIVDEIVVNPFEGKIP